MYFFKSSIQRKVLFHYSLGRIVGGLHWRLALVAFVPTICTDRIVPVDSFDCLCSWEARCPCLCKLAASMHGWWLHILQRCINVLASATASYFFAPRHLHLYPSTRKPVRTIFATSVTVPRSLLSWNFLCSVIVLWKRDDSFSFRGMRYIPDHYSPS